MAVNLDCCSRTSKPPEPEMGEKLSGQLLELEDAVRAIQDGVADLGILIEPVLLPEVPVAVGNETTKFVPAACPIGERLRVLTAGIRFANQTIRSIQRRLAVG